MRNKHYETLISVANDYLDGTIAYFSSYTVQFKKTAKEIKSRAHGGYEIELLTKKFEKEVNYKCTELLDKVENLFLNSGRKLSTKQYNDLTNRCIEKFKAIINNYYSIFRDEFENIETYEIFFKSLNENVTFKCAWNIVGMGNIYNCYLKSVDIIKYRCVFTKNLCCNFKIIKFKISYQTVQFTLNSTSVTPLSLSYVLIIL